MKNEDRPDPDQLLELVNEDEVRSTGHLKIYLGMAAGVGKTFAMLSDAIAQKNRGTDIVVGYLEHHGRKETESLADELECIPAIEVTVSGAIFRELDLDRVLLRKPTVVVVDELAHTNAPSLRHKKRWQDVTELLRAGISVLTTVNIQHIESLKDVVAKVTGISVHESVPDEILAQADDIEVIDIPPRELIERLQEGKVYPPERIGPALGNFFREGNLIALRELVLRQTAERVDAQMRRYRLRNSVNSIWPTKSRVMVCVGPSPTAAQLVRAAKRLAESMHADLVAVSLESPQYLMRSEQDRALATSALELARSLGAEIVVHPSQDMVEDLNRLSIEKNITGIVIGKSIQPKWKVLLSRSLVDELLIRSAGIDIHVLSISPEPVREFKGRSEERLIKVNLLASLGIIGIVTALCFLFPEGANLSNIVMVYLLATAWIAFRYSRAETILGSVAAVLAFDFFFVPPRLTLAVTDVQFLPTFGVMLTISLLISSLTLRLKAQSEVILRREQRALLLADLGKLLLGANSLEEIGRTLNSTLEKILKAEGHIIFRDEPGELFAYPATDKFTAAEQAVAAWSLSQGLPAGKSTNTLPGAAGLYLPIISDTKVIAILGIFGDVVNRFNDEQTVAAVSNQISLALKRIFAEQQGRLVQLEAESERLRNTMLSSISHDLRTPLAAIEGSASALVEKTDLSQASRLDLSRSILEQSKRLHSLIRNILNFTKLESGKFELDPDWQSLEELLGAAISQIPLEDHQIKVHCPVDLDLVSVDGILIQQVFQNLIYNFISHTPAGNELTINVVNLGQSISIEFADNGPGIETGEEERIFEKLYRPTNSSEGGFGLGLAICRAVMKMHEGQIYAKNNILGGTSIFVVIPRVKQPNLDIEIEN